jgi:hypothetical protein
MRLQIIPVLVVNDIPSQAEESHHSNRRERDIVFPPFMTMFRHPGIGVMIVVPSFSVGQQCHPPGISTLIGCLIVSITPHVTSGINEPRGMHDTNQSHARAPSQRRKAERDTSQPKAEGEQ